MTLTHEQLIYQRTLSGRTEALLSRESLSEVERGLLLSVNGYTPLSVLVALRRDGQAAARAVEHLLALKLIEAVVPELDSEQDDRFQPHAA